MMTLLLVLSGVFVFAIAATALCAKQNAKKKGPNFEVEPSFSEAKEA
ncbi:MAG: hypothetical protein K0S29_523 [Gammaproteobacteria bacterium]|nr:hypothetical protein [Gammaproteobacteria bacterium]